MKPVEEVIGRCTDRRTKTWRRYGSAAGRVVFGLVLLAILTLVQAEDFAHAMELVSPNEQTDGYLGWSVSGIPDVNGDGRGEVLVGAYREGAISGATDAGRAHIFSGSDGVLLSTLISPNEQIGGFLGWSISGIPDVDGDGRGDVVVAAPSEGPGASPYGAGRAYIYSGSGWAVLNTLVSPNEEAMGHFGYSVSGIPDVNGDGRGDVVVGAYWEDPGGSPIDAGRAYIFSGSDGILLTRLVSPNEELSGRFGVSVSGIPDVNGDGRGDVIVGASREDPATSPDMAGRAYIISGSNGLLLRTLLSPNEEAMGQFGYSVSGIPDVDGDGRDDVVVGAPYESPGASPLVSGRAYIFSGSNGILLKTLMSPNEESYGRFGLSVSGIPDVDGDGRGDVVVGAAYEDPGTSPNESGRAYILSGSSGTLLSTLISPNEEASGFFGVSVSSIPDLDGDGRGDVIVGTDGEDPGASPNNAGRAYVFRSAPDISVTLPGVPPLDFGNHDVGAGPTVSQTVAIGNEGITHLNFMGAGIVVTGPDASEFVITSVTDTSPLVSGATRTVDIAFDPSTTGSKSAYLTVTTDDIDEPTVNIPLTGAAYLAVDDWMRY